MQRLGRFSTSRHRPSHTHSAIPMTNGLTWCIDRRAISGSSRTVAEWARGFVRSNPTNTLSLLKDLNAGVAQRVQYQTVKLRGPNRPTILLTAAGLVPRLRRVVYRGRAQARLRWPPSLGLFARSGHDLVGSAEAARPTLGPRCLYRVRLDHLRPN